MQKLLLRLVIMLSLSSCSVIDVLSPSENEVTIVSNGVCLVTDTKGLGDRSFNDTAWKGVTDAQDQLGIEAVALESQVASDYEKNIGSCVQAESILTVSVGYLIGNATATAATTNNDHRFAIVDFSYDPGYENVLGLEFATDQAAFLAGYLAAGVTQTGKVGTYGGVNIPTVTVFMDGFAMGVEYYNEVHGTDVQVIGWDPVLQIGLFTNTFDVVQKGVVMGELLVDEGVDIIMPVAGGVGQGTASVAKDRGGVYIIGVDTDWTLSSPEFTEFILTSVTKHMDVAVFNAIQEVLEDTFEGGLYIGTLENDGVGLAPFHALDHLVSDELKTELEQVKADIIVGDINTQP
ncbi:MAG: BMP family ABC transporter substrate-binding protein [Anaerolineales bacterium]|nr:BMP family ABC transporter substrate-binding protein [Anaerolineales bacterium]